MDVNIFLVFMLLTGLMWVCIGCLEICEHVFFSCVYSYVQFVIRSLIVTFYQLLTKQTTVSAWFPDVMVLTSSSVSNISSHILQVMERQLQWFTLLLLNREIRLMIKPSRMREYVIVKTNKTHFSNATLFGGAEFDAGLEVYRSVLFCSIYYFLYL